MHVRGTNTQEMLVDTASSKILNSTFFPTLVPSGAQRGVSVIRAPEGLTSSNSDLLDLVSQRKPQSACQSGSPHDLRAQAWSQWAAQSSPTASWVTHSQ